MRKNRLVNKKKQESSCLESPPFACAPRQDDERGLAWSREGQWKGDNTLARYKSEKRFVFLLLNSRSLEIEKTKKRLHLDYTKTSHPKTSLPEPTNQPQSPVPVLVDFWAVWCGPCKLVAPLMSAVEKEMAGKLKVVKVNADPCPNLVEKYKVYGLPTLSLFNPGNATPVAQREGAIGKKALLEWLAANGIEAGVAK